MRNAVSEVTGYIYIFGIVMAVLAIVSVQVHSMLEDMKRNVLSQSLEQSFRRIEHIVYSVAFGGMPAQSVEIELQGGTIYLKKAEPEFIIAFVNFTNSISNCQVDEGDHFNLYCLNLSTARIYEGDCVGEFDKKACVLNRTVGILRYEYGDWAISIEGGAVFSKRGDYSKLIYDPRILVNTTAGNSRYLLMTIPQMDGNLSTAGSGRIKLLVSEGNGEINFKRIEGVNFGGGAWNNFDKAYLMIRNTEHQDAWCRFLERFELLNTSLENTNCHGKLPCNCRIADLPIAKIEPDVDTNMLIVFKTVIFAQQ